MTVTPAVASGMLGAAPAWIVVEPTETPTSEIVWLVAPVGMKTVAGTVATFGLSEDRFIVTPPAGAGADMFSVIRFSLPLVLIVKLACAKLTVAITCITWVKEPDPSPVAVMVTDPKLIP